MDTFTLIVVIICMLIYTIYAIWQILQFEHPASGIFGTAAVIAGGVGLYLILPVILAVIIWILKILGILALIGFVICIFSS